MKRKIIQLLLKMGWTGLAYSISPSLTAYYQGKALGEALGEALDASLRKDIWKE